jgi:GlcNAc-P-P-Und epimerase
MAIRQLALHDTNHRNYWRQRLYRPTCATGLTATQRDLWVWADVRDKDSLRAGLQGCDAILNLAAAHRDDVRPVQLYHDVNVTGAQNICDIAHELGITRLFFTSSVAIYGMPDSVPDENSPANPFNPYGETKWVAEQVYRRWADQDTARQLEIIRPTVVFGPGNRGNVYNLLAQIARGRFIMIGNGQNRKSMAYVENVSGFLCHLIQQPVKAGTRIYNYVDKPDFTMNDLVQSVRTALGRAPSRDLRLPRWLGLLAGTGFDILAHLSGRSFAISRIRVQKFCANSVYAADKKADTGYTPPFDLRDALTKTIRHEFGADSQ